MNSNVNPFEEKYSYTSSDAGMTEMESQPNPFAETPGVDSQPTMILFPTVGKNGVDNPPPRGGLEIPLSNQPAVTPSGTTAHEVDPELSRAAATGNAGADSTEGGIAERVFQYIQYYFQVDTDMVLHRLLSLVKIHTAPDYLRGHDWHFRSGPRQTEANSTQSSANRPHSDIYGPFWTMTTLWVMLGVVTNLLSRIKYEAKVSSAVSENTEAPQEVSVWGYDFGIVVTGASVIAAFWLLLPAILWMGTKFNGKTLDFADLACLHGYSLNYFLVAILLCSIPFNIVQYIMIFSGATFASVFLILNLWGALMRDVPYVWGLALIAITLLLQFALAIVLKLYFFNY